MWTIFALATLGASGESLIQNYPVDAIELNFYYDKDTGQRILTQYIFWRDYGRAGFHVTDWRSAKNGCSGLMSRDGEYVLPLQNNVHVTSKRYFESHTTYDREVKDRDKWPREARETIQDGIWQRTRQRLHEMRVSPPPPGG